MIKLNWIEEKQWPPRVCPATTNSVKIKHRLDWIGNWIRVELYCSFMHYTKYNSEPRKQHYLVYWSSASNGTIRLPSTWRIEVQLSIAATQFQYASAVVHHLMYWSVASIGSNTTTACLSGGGLFSKIFPPPELVPTIQTFPSFLISPTNVFQPWSQ